MNVFVTGGTGFIGAHVVMNLLKKNHEVTILARNSRKARAFDGVKGVTIIDGEIQHFSRIEKALAGHDGCIHIALGWGDSALDMLMNETRPSVFIAEAAARAGVKHYIYCSSIEAVGGGDRTLDEEMIPLATNAYGASKAAVEQFTLAVSHAHPMRCNIIRPGCTLGNHALPGCGPDGGLLNDFVLKALKNEPFEIDPDDGIQITSGEDMAKVFAAVLESKVNRQIYFGMSGRKMYFRDILKVIIELTGSKSTVSFTKEPSGLPPVLFETGKIKRDLGLELDSWPDVLEHLRSLCGRLK